MAQPVKILSIITFILTIILVALHYAVAARAHIWYDNNALYTYTTADSIVNYGQKNNDQYVAYIIIISTAVLFLAIALLVDAFKQCFSPKIRIILIAFTLIFQWSLAVVISLMASTSSNQIDLMQFRYGHSFDNLDSYHKLAVADSVITWIFKVVPLAILFILSVFHLGAVSQPVPPASANRF